MTLDQQFASLAVMILMGMWLGVSFTVYQRFIRPRGRSRLILLVTDPLFWILQAFLVFAVLLPVNEGQLRLYLFLALALGFSIYQALFASFFLSVLNRIMDMTIRTGRFLWQTVLHLLIFPLFGLLKLVSILCKIVLSTILKCLAFPVILLLRIIRGVLHLILPGSWFVRAGLCLEKVKRYLGKWLSIIIRRR